MMAQDGPISIQQSLHGYMDGHSLIASSRDFPPTVRRTLLVLSDMSGQSMEPGFECYLTAYPIESESVYAFAKTWHAAEKPRSGCVWTHTLLIPFADLHRIRDLSSVTPLFRRPSSSEPDFSSYETAINYIDGPAFKSNVTLYAIDQLRMLAMALYDDDVPVFIVADNATLYESLFLRLWSRQWSKLRQQFCFCTGAIDSRSHNSAPFDLQVCPRSAWHQIQRTVETAIRVDVQEAIVNHNSELSAKWADIVTADWCDPNQSGYFSFIEKYGDELNPSRKSAGLLARVFNAFRKAEKTDTIHEVLNLIGLNFPSSTEAKGMKVHTVLEGFWRKGTPETRGEILRSLATANLAPAFDAEALRLSYLAEELWREEPGQGTRTISAVTDEQNNPIRSAIIEGIAKAIQPHQIGHLALVETEAACELIRSRPSLAAISDVWHHGSEQHELLMNTLQSSEQVSPDLKLDIINAQIKAGAEDTIDLSFKWTSDIFVDAVLDALSLCDQDVSSIQSWVKRIKSQRKRITSWIDRNHYNAGPAAIAWCAKILDPDSKSVQNMSLKIWSEWSSKLCMIEERYLTSSAVFFFIVGVSNTDDVAGKIVCNSFPIVYSAAKRDKLSEAAWKQVKSHLGYSGWTWDRCKVLREGIVEVFAEREWSRSEFLACTDDTNMLKAILKKWWSKTERNYLSSIADQLEFLDASDEQKRLFKKYI